jgi:hypothetical protein
VRRTRPTSLEKGRRDSRQRPLIAGKVCGWPGATREYRAPGSKRRLRVAFGARAVLEREVAVRAAHGAGDSFDDALSSFCIG